MKIHYSSWMISVTGREFNSPVFSAQELSGGFEINFKPISPSSSPNTMNIHIYKKKKKRLKISPPSYMWASLWMTIDQWIYKWTVYYLALTRYKRGKIDMFFQNQKVLVILAHSLAQRGRKGTEKVHLPETEWNPVTVLSQKLLLPYHPGMEMKYHLELYLYMLTGNTGE